MQEKHFHTIQYQQTELHYVQSGEGTKTMLTFHGFGLTSDCFLPIENHLQKAYTFYNFDLFFHGKSFLNPEIDHLDTYLWKELIQIFLQKHQIKSFSILAFSIGGKPAIASLYEFKPFIEGVYLIAPDGIQRKFLYEFSTNTIFGKQLFKWILNQSGLLKSGINFLYKINLIDKSSFRLATSQLDTPEKRYKLYHTWLAYSKLYFKPKSIAEIIKTYHIKIVFFVGRYDKIISPKDIQPLTKYLENPEIHTLSVKHTKLIQTVADFFENKVL